MNTRLLKIYEEIEKTKTKLNTYQARLKELEQKKTQIENAEIVAAVREVQLPPDGLAEFISSIKTNQSKKGKGGTDIE